MKAANRRQQVIVAAREVLEIAGMGGLTMRAIATQAQIPLSTIHYVFPSKETIIEAIVNDLAAEIAETLSTPRTDHDTFDEAIRAAARSFWTTLVEGRRELQLMQYDLTLYGLRTPALAAMPAHQYRAYIRAVATRCATIAHDTRTTLTITTDDLARTIVALADGLILQYVSDPDDARARRALDTGLSVLLAGVAHHGGVHPHNPAQDTPD